MAVKITAQPRPKIPYEHPDLKMYGNSIRENLIRQRYKKKAYSRHDAYIREVFRSSAIPLETQCQQLVSYIAEAFEHYAVWDHTHAYYPGRPSQQTARVDAIEGVSRVLPTLAAWLHTRKPQPKEKDSKAAPILIGLNDRPIDVVSILRSAFLAGTDPTHKGYWGRLHDYDQRTCEAADLALALWLSRDWVWDSFSAPEQQQVADWFKQVNRVETVDNNWHLFPLTVQFVLLALTGEDCVDHDRYQRIRDFYVGDGWFRDGARGNYDFYNAWGFHYSLYWLQQIAPDYFLDHNDGEEYDFMRRALAQFSGGYRHFFTPEGLPLFGRSACYRLAAAAPLLSAVDMGLDPVAVGEAKRAFACSLRYFIGNGALQNGAPTQGIFGDDVRLVDNYSGPASSLWSLRALNIALFCGHRSGLWQAAESPLAVERGDFECDIQAIGARVIGIQQTREVTVIFREDPIQLVDSSDLSPLTRRLVSQSRRKRWLERLTGRAQRPKNNLLRKGVTCYSSKMAHFF